MKFLPTDLTGLLSVRLEPVADARGSLSRLFDAAAFESIVPGFRVAQVNLTVTHRRGTVRGMHFQRAPVADAKFVRCIRGRVHDVVVDLRASSPTRLAWRAFDLSGDGVHGLFVPPGFAHGFQALEDDVEMLYVHGADYAPAHEGGIAHDDPALAIAWPLPVGTLSQRDAGLPRSGPAFEWAAP